MAERSSRAKFARLVNILDEHERKKTANVERATDGLDPVTRDAIMEAAKLDAKFVESETRAHLAGMLTEAIRRSGREVRALPRLNLFAVRDTSAPWRREHVPEEFLAGAKESYADLLAEIDHVIAIAKRGTTKTGVN